MAEVSWLKGQLTGSCVGKPTRKRGGSGLARWYKLRLVDAVIGDWAPTAGPPKDAPDGQAPFSQALLKDARLRAKTAGGTDELISLRELSVWDWKIRDQREGGGESRCTLTGTVYARAVDGTRRPVPPEGSDRLDQWGFLTLLLGLLVAFWLWWTCGPFTAGLWSAVVVGSWFSHGLRNRRRSPPTTVSKVLQSILALLLVLGGVFVVIGMADPARASACGGEAIPAVLVTLASVILVSLLTVSWPRLWIWAVWTVVVAMWCGHTGADCTWLWIKGAIEKGKVSTIEQELQRLRWRVLGTPEGLGGSDAGTASGPGGPGGGADGGASGSGSGAGGGSGTGASGGFGPGTGSGSGSGTGSGTGDGSGLGSSSGSGSGSGDGSGSGSGLGAGGSASGTSDGSGASGSDSSAGSGDGSAAAGLGSGGTRDRRGAPASAGDGDGTAKEEGTEEASGESRMSVEAALRDPKPFLDGTARVTIAGDLLFAFDEDALKPGAEPKLREVARLLRVDPRLRVLLEGHADTIGGEQYNLDLSERRAQAVRTWLVDQAHINPMRIDTIGYGSAKPLVSLSAGHAAQQANRRVEIRVLSPSPP